MEDDPYTFVNDDPWQRKKPKTMGFFKGAKVIIKGKTRKIAELRFDTIFERTKTWLRMQYPSLQAKQISGRALKYLGLPTVMGNMPPSLHFKSNIKRSHGGHADLSLKDPLLLLNYSKRVRIFVRNFTTKSHYLRALSANEREIREAASIGSSNQDHVEDATNTSSPAVSPMLGPGGPTRFDVMLEIEETGDILLLDQVVATAGSDFLNNVSFTYENVTSVDTDVASNQEMLLFSSPKDRKKTTEYSETDQQFAFEHSVSEDDESFIGSYQDRNDQDTNHVSDQEERNSIFDDGCHVPDQDSDKTEEGRNEVLENETNNREETPQPWRFQDFSDTSPVQAKSSPKSNEILDIINLDIFAIEVENNIRSAKNVSTNTQDIISSVKSIAISSPITNNPTNLATTNNNLTCGEDENYVQITENKLKCKRVNLSLKKRKENICLPANCKPDQIMTESVETTENNLKTHKTRKLKLSKLNQNLQSPVENGNEPSEKKHIILEGTQEKEKAIVIKQKENNSNKSVIQAESVDEVTNLGNNQKPGKRACLIVAKQKDNVGAGLSAAKQAQPLNEPDINMLTASESNKKPGRRTRLSLKKQKENNSNKNIHIKQQTEIVANEPVDNKLPISANKPAASNETSLPLEKQQTGNITQTANTISLLDDSKNLMSPEVNDTNTAKVTDTHLSGKHMDNKLNNQAETINELNDTEKVESNKKTDKNTRSRIRKQQTENVTNENKSPEDEYQSLNQLQPVENKQEVKKTTKLFMEQKYSPIKEVQNVAMSEHLSVQNESKDDSELEVVYNCKPETIHKNSINERNADMKNRTGKPFLDINDNSHTKNTQYTKHLKISEGIIDTLTNSTREILKSITKVTTGEKTSKFKTGGFDTKQPALKISEGIISIATPKVSDCVILPCTPIRSNKKIKKHKTLFKMPPTPFKANPTNISKATVASTNQADDIIQAESLTEYNSDGTENCSYKYDDSAFGRENLLGGKLENKATNKSPFSTTTSQKSDNLSSKCSSNSYTSYNDNESSKSQKTEKESTSSERTVLNKWARSKFSKIMQSTPNARKRTRFISTPIRKVSASKKAKKSPTSSKSDVSSIISSLNSTVHDKMMQQTKGHKISDGISIAKISDGMSVASESSEDFQVKQKAMELKVSDALSDASENSDHGLDVQRKAWKSKESGTMSVASGRSVADSLNFVRPATRTRMQRSNVLQLPNIDAATKVSKYLIGMNKDGSQESYLTSLTNNNYDSSIEFEMQANGVDTPPTQSETSCGNFLVNLFDSEDSKSAMSTPQVTRKNTKH